MLLQRGRLFGFLLSAMLALLSYTVSFADKNILSAPRHRLFDTYQRLSPRERISAPVTIVAVDEESLSALGQWPWPRSRVSELFKAIGAYEPAAIGVDILFAEPDRLSPDMAEWGKDAPAQVRAWLAKRKSNDGQLAETIGALPLALGVGGMESPMPEGPLTPSRQTGKPSAHYLLSYEGLLRSIPVLDIAASGHGLLSAGTDPDGIVRRTPLAARLGDQLLPSLEMEMIRLAVGGKWFSLHGGPDGAEAVSAGDLRIPVQRDGTLWVHYGLHDPARFVSASAVLNGTVDPVKLNQQLVLVGVTGLGLIDYPATPVAARMPGVEIRAQILEAISDNSLLSRPSWAGWVEAGLTFLFCGLLSLTVPVVQPRWTPVIWLAGGGLLAAAGFGAFVIYRVLIDVAVPGIAGSLLFLALLASTLAEADRQRRLYKRDLEIQREREARFAGELEAARRIQMGILPDASKIRDPLGRIDVAAMLEPAREVGGDLYDIFLVDEGERLFFMVGDVSGKGIPASLFMALGKSLYKSAVLRQREDIALVMSGANAEIARENPEQLFITVFAAVLDLPSGRMKVANAGHDWPIIKPQGAPVTAWSGAGGPPLCVVDDFDYPGETRQLTPGAMVVLFTDGVTEAMDPDGAIYGLERLTALLNTIPDDLSARDVIDEIHADVKAHTLGAAPSDDIAILVVIWKGDGAL